MSDTPRTDESAGFPCMNHEVTAERLFEHARRLERELAEARKDSARLDWLEFRGPWEAWSEPCGEAEITLRAPIRAAIDAAMKEVTP